MLGELRCDHSKSELTNDVRAPSDDCCGCSAVGSRQLSFGLLIMIVGFGKFKILPNCHGNSMASSYPAKHLKTELFDIVCLVNASKIQLNLDANNQQSVLCLAKLILHNIILDYGHFSRTHPSQCPNLYSHHPIN